MVDEKKVALQINAFNYSQEDYGTYFIFGLPMGDVTSEVLLKEIDEEIVNIQNNLISENDFQKLQNKFENNYVNSNSTVEGIAENLASYYLLYGDINLVNTEIEIYRSITREDIKEVAKKYLNPNQRLILNYGPAKEKTAK
jgi:predicted Zn-dependent peptidase